jgi:hypothetical protein
MIDGYVVKSLIENAFSAIAQAFFVILAILLRNRHKRLLSLCAAVVRRSGNAVKTDPVQYLSALFNQVAKPNSERNGNTVQLHDADIPYASLYPGYERPMQSSPLRQLFLR